VRFYALVGGNGSALEEKMNERLINSCLEVAWMFKGIKDFKAYRFKLQPEDRESSGYHIFTLVSSPPPD
jgi:hypothetical protein